MKNICILKLINITQDYKYMLSCILIVGLYTLSATAAPDSKTEKTIDGIIEVHHQTDDNVMFYEYNTVDADKIVRMLRNDAEHTVYDILFPEGTKREGATKQVVSFRDSILSVLCNISEISKPLSGKRIMVFFYIKADGTTICRNIVNRERLLDFLSTDAMKQMINIINSYKFKASNVKGNYYLDGMVVLQFP